MARPGPKRSGLLVARRCGGPGKGRRPAAGALRSAGAADPAPRTVAEVRTAPPCKTGCRSKRSIYDPYKARSGRVIGAQPPEKNWQSSRRRGLRSHGGQLWGGAAGYRSLLRNVLPLGSQCRQALEIYTVFQVDERRAGLCQRVLWPSAADAGAWSRPGRWPGSGLRLGSQARPGQARTLAAGTRHLRRPAGRASFSLWPNVR